MMVQIGAAAESNCKGFRLGAAVNFTALRTSSFISQQHQQSSTYAIPLHSVSLTHSRVILVFYILDQLQSQWLPRRGHSHLTR